MSSRLATPFRKVTFLGALGLVPLGASCAASPPPATPPALAPPIASTPSASATLPIATTPSGTAPGDACSPEGATQNADACQKTDGMCAFSTCENGHWAWHEVPPRPNPNTGPVARPSTMEPQTRLTILGGGLKFGTVTVGGISCGSKRSSPQAPMASATQLTSCTATFVLGTEVVLVWSSWDSSPEYIVHPTGHVTKCGARGNMRRCALTLDGDKQVIVNASLLAPSGSFTTSAAPADLADGSKPFSIAMWIKPTTSGGTLAHVSSGSDGTGWCTPFLGYDDSGRIVSQVLRGNGPAATEFAVAAAQAPPLGAWSHVAMTWEPGASNRLYVNGVEAAATAAPTYHATGVGTPLMVTWGASNTNGATCWQGAVHPGAFDGAVHGMTVLNRALTAAEVGALAKAKP